MPMAVKSVKKFPYIDFQMLVKAIIDDQIVSHSNSMRLKIEEKRRLEGARIVDLIRRRGEE